MASSARSLAVCTMYNAKGFGVDLGIENYGVYKHAI
jgi:hypothetical protein